MDAFISAFVLSCDLGVAKPAPEPFLTACERLEVSPERTLMVGNNRLADSGSICVGCHCLILPPGAARCHQGAARRDRRGGRRLGGIATR
jgi:FMN phosphatase YigB (HAD superfamily)